MVDLSQEYRRAQQYREAGDPVGEARILEPILAVEPGNSQIRLQLALAYFASAQLGGAERELRALIDQDPSDHYAHHVLGRTLERQNRPREALKHLRLAAAMSVTAEYGEALRRVEARVGGSGRR